MKRPGRARRTAMWWPLLWAVALAQPAAEVVAPGALQPPTSPRFADVAWYDVQDVRWVGGDEAPAALDVVLAAIDPVQPLLQPVIELYLLAEDGSGRSPLPGSGVAMPEGEGWHAAVRIAGGRAWVWVAQPGIPSAPRPLDLTVLVPERTLRLAWPALPAVGRWVAITGVYDPFAADAWRPFAATPSPWAFARSVPGPAVVDVWPGDAGTWSRVVATGTLPASSSRRTVGAPSGARWWWWMGLGMALALAGWGWRSAPWVARRFAAWRGAAAVPPPSSPVLIGDDEVATGDGGERDAAPPPEGRDATASLGPTASATTEAAEDAAAPAEDAEGAVAPVEDAEGAAPPAEDAGPTDQREVPGDRGTATAASDAPSDAGSDPARATDAPSDESRSANRS